MPPSNASTEGLAAPSISVVICAYTEARLGLIEAAIESLSAQTISPDELILVIDHAPELEAECRRRWPTIRVIHNRERQGLSGARNTGLQESSGEVVAFLDDDAVAAPNLIELLGRAYADRRVLGVGGTVRPMWSVGRPRWFPAEFDWVVGCTHSGMPRQVATVRNLVGANMSFRRETLIQTGGFRYQLGRIGTIPAGCEETDLCIRIGRLWPRGQILYDPDAIVEHHVPAARASLGYFVSRCRGEGRSKAVLAGLVGSDSGLEAERSYVRSTLPRGFLRGIMELFHGDASGPARSASIVLGLLVTSFGYVSTTRRRRQLAHRRALLEAETPEASPRILMVTPRSPLSQGGVERHVFEISRRLAASGATVEVLCTEPGGEPVRDEEREGVRIRVVRAWPRNRDWCFAPRIWREMSRQPWDLVHVQSYHTLVAPLAMLRALTLGIPYVVTFHGGGHTSEARNRLRRLQRWLLRPLLARAERLIAVARFEIDAYGKELRLARERFVLIPNGTNIAFSRTANTSNGEPDSAPTLASIGRLERYKGHHRVIAALPQLLELEPDARLLVVGTGPYERELKKQAADLGVSDRVDFTSTPADRPEAMADLLAGVSLVVLMSEFETHPLVALEAAAAGRRLLVADAGGLSELAEDGLARAIPLNESPAGLARTIAAELERPAPAIRPRLSSWDECSEELLELYRALA